MTCSRWRGPCFKLGTLEWCACVDEAGHGEACVCPCGHSRPVRDRCRDCAGDPCPCGKPGLPRRPDEPIVVVYPDPPRRRSRVA